MSLVFPFALPTTGNLALSTHLRSIDYQPIVMNADATRAAVRDSLKRAKRADSPDTLGVIKTLEEYIPYLFTIIDGLEKGDFDLITEVSPSWRMPLRTSRSQINVVEAPRVEIMGLEYERGMILITYALSLIVQSDKVIQAISEASQNEDAANQPWKQATSYLLKAESVLSYLANTPPAIEQQEDTSIPIDLQPTTISGLSNLVKGSLHLLILLKSSSASSAVSPGLLSRISIYTTERFSSALQLLQPSATTKHDKMKAKVGFSDSLTNWLINAQAYSTASAYRYMAVESAKNNQVGRAIGLLDLSSQTLASMKKSKKDSERLISLGQQVKSDVDTLYQSYKAENDRLAFQKIPDLKELQHNWPSGREATTLKPPWSPPTSLLRDYNQRIPAPGSSTSSSGYY